MNHIHAHARADLRLITLELIYENMNKYKFPGIAELGISVQSSEPSKPVTLETLQSAVDGTAVSPGGSLYTRTPREIKVGIHGIQDLQAVCHEKKSSKILNLFRPRSEKDSRSIRRTEQYVTILKLGRGQCPVHLAIHVPTFQLVAVKAIKYQNRQGIKHASSELKVLYANSCSLGYQGKRRISNSVRFFDAFIEKSHLKLVLEYMDGGSISDYIAKHGPMKDARLRWVTYRVTKCLASLHQRQILHRDIKPGNVLVSAKGNVYLSDFGTAVSVPQHSERTDIRGSGTAQFMCQKRLHGGLLADNLCYASDVWSLGMTVYCLAVGKPIPHLDAGSSVTIYVKLSERGFHRELNELRTRPQLHDFLKKCLDPDPSARLMAKQLLKHEFVHKAKRVCVCCTSEDKKLDQLTHIVKSLYDHYRSKISEMHAHKVRMTEPDLNSTVDNGIIGRPCQIHTTSLQLNKTYSNTKPLRTMPPAQKRNHSRHQKLNTVESHTRRRFGFGPVSARTHPIPMSTTSRDVHSAPNLGPLSTSQRRKLTPSKAAANFLADQLDLPRNFVWRTLACKMPWIKGNM